MLQSARRMRRKIGKANAQQRQSEGLGRAQTTFESGGSGGSRKRKKTEVDHQRNSGSKSEKLCHKREGGSKNLSCRYNTGGKSGGGGGDHFNIRSRPLAEEWEDDKRNRRKTSLEKEVRKKAGGARPQLHSLRPHNRIPKRPCWKKTRTMREVPGEKPQRATLQKKKSEKRPTCVLNKVKQAQR